MYDEYFVHVIKDEKIKLNDLLLDDVLWNVCLNSY